MSTQITIQASQGYIVGLPTDQALMDALREATSFRPEGYQYTTLYKRGKSDGRVKLMKNSRFPAGLLQTVTTVLTEHGVEYDLNVIEAVDQKPRLAMDVHDIESRDYQDHAVEKALLNPRGVIHAPTGSGKTAIQARVIADRGRHALIVVPTIDLLYQSKRFLEKHLSGQADGDLEWVIGQLGDGVVDPRPVTVATVRTAAKVMGTAYEKYDYGEYDDRDDTKVNPRELRQFVEEIGTLVVDEAHILGAQTVYDLANAVPAPNKYGFSASPWRDDGADLQIEAATGPVIYTITTKELVAGGYLVPPVIQVIDTSSWYRAPAYGQVCTRCGQQRERGPRGRYVPACVSCGGTNFRSEWQQAEKEMIVENQLRNAEIAKLVQTLPKPALVLVKQVKHGRTLQDLIPGSVFLSGKDTGAERANVFERVRRGDQDVVVCTVIADMGLDIPALRTLVLAGGGKSSTRHLQRIGRIVRPYDGKRSALVVDFDDGHVHTWFQKHQATRRKIEKAEWRGTALWV